VAGLILKLSASASELIYEPLPQDDPKQRRPDISRAREALGWEPHLPAEEGLSRTIEWFAARAEGKVQRETARTPG
jgi:nucleoside-diphosphate-sugar epimerase